MRRAALRAFSVALSFALLSQISQGSTEPRSTQSCNTDCQAQQTNCSLRCDQDTACIKTCQQAAETCVAKCRGPREL
jgi:hypothetical protein